MGKGKSGKTSHGRFKEDPNLVHYGPLFPEMSRLIAVLEELQFGTLLRHDVKSEA